MSWRRHFRRHSHSMGRSNALQIQTSSNDLLVFCTTCTWHSIGLALTCSWQSLSLFTCLTAVPTRALFTVGSSPMHFVLKNYVIIECLCHFRLQTSSDLRIPSIDFGPLYAVERAKHGKAGSVRTLCEYMRMLCELIHASPQVGHKEICLVPFIVKRLSFHQNTSVQLPCVMAAIVQTLHLCGRCLHFQCQGRFLRVEFC